MQGCYLRISRDVGWYSLQMEFIAVDCPGLVMHRLWGVPRSRLTYTLQRAQHSATWREHTHAPGLSLNNICGSLNVHLHPLS